MKPVGDLVSVKLLKDDTITELMSISVVFCLPLIFYSFSDFSVTKIFVTQENVARQGSVLLSLACKWIAIYYDNLAQNTSYWQGGGDKY